MAMRSFGGHRLFKGNGVRLRRFAGGYVVNFDHEVSGFEGAWATDLLGDGLARIAPGTINRFAAKIGKALLTDTPPPLLNFGKAKLASDGRGWICAEVTCDPARQWQIIDLQIVQVADPDHDEDESRNAATSVNSIGGARPLANHRARAPLAMLRKRDGGGIDVFQIAYFDLQHSVALYPDHTPQRHFFW